MRNTLTALILMGCTAFGVVSTEKAKQPKPAEFVVTNNAAPSVTSAVLRSPLCPLGCDCETCKRRRGECSLPSSTERVTKIQPVSRGACANGQCSAPQKSAPDASGSCASGNCATGGNRGGVFRRGGLFRRRG